MKWIHTFRSMWVFACLVGMVLAGCGDTVQDASITGPQPVARLGKAAFDAHVSRAGVSVLAWNFADGTPLVGAEVAFSRSVAGRSNDYRWMMTTDADGIAQMDLTSERRQGVGGYFSAKATDGTTGEVLGQWHSIPLNSGKEHVISLPLGETATVVSGSGPLAYTASGHYSFSGPSNIRFGSQEGWFANVIHGNTAGETWGLTVGLQTLLDVGFNNSPLRPVSDPGAVFNLPFELETVCFELTGEGNSFFHLTRWTKNRQPVLVGLQAPRRFTDMGGPGQDRAAFSSPFFDPEVQDLECGDDLDAFITDAVANQTGEDLNVPTVTFKVVRTGN